jgi:hypothetical protein
MKSYALSPIVVLHHLKRDAFVASFSRHLCCAVLAFEGMHKRVSLSRLPSHRASIYTPICTYADATAARRGSGVASLTCACMHAYAPHGTCGSTLPNDPTSYHNVTFIYPTLPQCLSQATKASRKQGRNVASQECVHPSGGNCCAGRRGGLERQRACATILWSPKSISTPSTFKLSTCGPNRVQLIVSLIGISFNRVRKVGRAVRGGNKTPSASDLFARA